MGLTGGSTGIHAVDTGLVIKKQKEDDLIIALAGNPNVGKSTVFNELTGLNQHTGNWPGKTVANAQGACTYRNQGFVLVDIPGSYSLMAHSAEEEVARDFICFGEPDGVVVVCDATCLERNLNLVLQTIEITDHVVVCVNLMDEAARKGIQINLDAIAKELGVPVIPTAARSGKGLDTLMETLCTLRDSHRTPIQIRYISALEEAISNLEPVLMKYEIRSLRPRWLALRLLEEDETLLKSLADYLGQDLTKIQEIADKRAAARATLAEKGIPQEAIQDKITASLVLTAEGICASAVECDCRCNLADRRIDRLLTSKWTGFPIMLALLALVFWLTITGANVPSQLLADGLFALQERLTGLLSLLGAPAWVNGLFVEGMYRTLAWVDVPSCVSDRTAHRPGIFV